MCYYERVAYAEMCVFLPQRSLAKHTANWNMRTQWCNISTRTSLTNATNTENQRSSSEHRAREHNYYTQIDVYVTTFLSYNTLLKRFVIAAYSFSFWLGGVALNWVFDYWHVFLCTQQRITLCVLSIWQQIILLHQTNKNTFWCSVLYDIACLILF